MTIRVPGDSSRRFAYIDRNNGRLELAGCAAATCDGGYFRGSKKYLSDFFLSTLSDDLYRVNALWTDVKADGFSVCFGFDGMETVLDVSLLFGEQALFLSCCGYGSGTGIGIVLEKDTSWRQHDTEGMTLFDNGSGMCIASLSPFRCEGAGSGRVVLFSVEPGLSFYLVMEDDPAAALQKAMRLARSAAIDAHRAHVASFLDGCVSESDAQEFDDAVRWIRFTGWATFMGGTAPATGVAFSGTCNTAARDMFGPIPGILLSGGRFAEARELLLSFGNFEKARGEHGFDGVASGFDGVASGIDGVASGIDGALLFVRSLWEYVSYTGDMQLPAVLSGAVDRILGAVIDRHTDQHGFLVHGDGDTWMDSVVRGDRACEMQALWYTALCIGSRLAQLAGDREKAGARDALAKKLKKSFRTCFWSACRNALADRLPPGGHGEWLPDFRVRPNQLFVITLPSVLDGEDADFVGMKERTEILENVKRELVSPYGLFSLCPDDPLFVPDGENHDGRIWQWNTGSFIEAAAGKETACLDAVSSALLVNQVTLAMTSLYIGTLSEKFAAAGLVRAVYQDIIGFRPFLSANRIEIHPHLPEWTDSWRAECPFGSGWKLSVNLERTGSEAPPEDAEILCTLFWNIGNDISPNAGTLLANGVPLVPGKALHLLFPGATVKKGRKGSNGRKVRFPCVAGGVCTDGFPVRQPPDFLRSLRAGARLSVRNGVGENAAVLEAFFDSARFGKKYNTALPLGALWSRDETLFRLWAPTARSVSLVLFRDGGTSNGSVVLPMREQAGVWELPLAGDQNGTWYCFRVRVHGIVRDSPDPYARACGVNGTRSMVIDFASANPDGWDALKAPALASPNEAIVYEVHVADITSSPSWNGNPALRRTYTGAAERGTAINGIPTGFDHIKSLAVTHVQLMPVFDFTSVDESRLTDQAYGERPVGGKFNWGYDPGNWSVPEGSYSTDPFDGAMRIRELKTLIGVFLANGIGVIMDVVYNHVPAAWQHPLDICVPGYYFRLDGFSGAGDDTASERAMFRSFMIDSLCFWLSEYKLSGFRFDLMGLHDIETMNAAAAALRKIKPDVLLYGEGWDMYRGTGMVGATQLEARKLDRIGFFNDALRCGIKGSIFGAHAGGFIHDGSRREAVKFGLVGAVYHPCVHNSLVDGTANPNPWTDVTASSVNYTEIHDNTTLYDKLVLVEDGKDAAYYARMQRTAIALVLFAQGMPVLHAGMEFMRTKEIPSDLLASNPGLTDVYRSTDGKRAFSHNSYNLYDRINGLDWHRCADNRDTVEYVRQLIAVRKAHPLFRLRTAAEVVSSMIFLESGPALPAVITSQAPAKTFDPPLLAWKIDGTGSLDSWKSVCIVVNPAQVAVEFSLPVCAEGMRWHLIADGDSFREGEPVAAGTVTTETVTSIAPKVLYLYAEF